MNASKNKNAFAVFGIFDLVRLNHVSAPVYHHLSIAIVLSVVILGHGVSHALGQGLPHFQEYDPSSILVPPDIPTSATRDILFQLDDAASWLKETDRESFDVSRIEGVELFGDFNQELMEYVASFPQAWAVTIYEHPNGGFNRAMAPLARMKKLKLLVLEMPLVSARDCSFLANLSSMTEFRCGIFLYEKDFYSLGALPALTTLDISGIVRHPRVVVKQPKKQFLNLRKLSVSSTRYLKYFESSVKLQKLVVRGPVSEVDVKLISRFISRSKALKEMSLAVPKSNLKVIQPLLELENLPTLNFTISPLPPKKSIRLGDALRR